MLKKSLTILLSISFLLGTVVYGETAGLRNVTVHEAYEMTQDLKDDESFIILDVRRPSEFAAGHLENAINIDYYSNDFRNELELLDKDQTYLVYCRSGRRSANTLKIMDELGFIDAANMLGGIKAWKKAEYPLVVEEE